MPTRARAGLDPDEHAHRAGARHVAARSSASRAISRSMSAASSSPASRLDEVVPIVHAAMEDRTIIEWDKDDLDALSMLKVDVLALGMLTA